MELTGREQRAVMLETQRPAYARSDEVRRSIDNIYKRARNLQRALPAGIQVSVRALIPHEHKYVSGLNVPNNLATLIGKTEIAQFKTRLNKAKKRLEARHA